MISFKTFLNRATSLFKPEEAPVSTCPHEFEHNGQAFVRVAPKLYQLTDKQICKLCKEERFFVVGETDNAK